MNIHYMNLQRDYDCHNVLQVHDELVYEVPDENADACLPYIEELMAHPFGSDLFCPLEADCHKGKNWMEAKG
ncbi:MAG: DNA polymerase, partial [Minisyncoccia bacterium]